MNRSFKLNASLMAVALLALPLAHAADMSKSDYSAAKTRLDADYKSEKTACALLAGNAKDICQQEAKGKEKVARAELEFGYTAKPADQNKVLVARAESIYAVAKEKCDDLSGNVKDVCVKEAKAVEVKSLADAKMGKQIQAARVDASADKTDANFKVAAEKCEALSGDAKASCMSDAKAKSGKN